MKLHAIASAVAIAAAMVVGPVAAQEFTIGGKVVPLEQVQNFQQACEGLRAASTASLTTSPPEDEALTTGSVQDPSASSGSPDPASQDNWEELLATLTIEDCEAGGFAAAE